MERAGLRVLFAGDVILMLEGDENPTSQARKPLGTYSAYLPPHFRGDPEAYLNTLALCAIFPPRISCFPVTPAPTRRHKAHALRRSAGTLCSTRAFATCTTSLIRLAADGKDFLDGNPKRLLRASIISANSRARPCMAFSASSQFFLVDAPGGPGLRKWVNCAARSTGSDSPLNPAAILLTSCGPEATAGLDDMLAQTRATVVAVDRWARGSTKAVPARNALRGGRGPAAQGWFDVNVIPLRGRGVAPVAYSVTIRRQERFVFRTDSDSAQGRAGARAGSADFQLGRKTSRLPDRRRSTAHRKSPTSGCRRCRQIVKTPIFMIMTGHNIIAYNYQVGFRAPKGPGRMRSLRGNGRSRAARARRWRPELGQGIYGLDRRALVISQLARGHRTSGSPRAGRALGRA